ncbi:AidB family quorum-quenching N-acyl homoserine lactonase [Lichenifustis flavocetrariae]|uniref:MBL fold metallo-hydrolase n=1 Tax=Lichenifustis flavocetrariae TaxID=2949735 RepID=A0AA41YT92_9HYPH|nr:MBL fold metallo-hydrolase [Lichenifustis flavocetrariae]MCW6508166.1 MBL fold metallo-hydrolase [Lichenifustis flavocetrariae]
MDQLSQRVGRYNVALLKDGIFDAPPEVLTHVGGADQQAAMLARWGQSRVQMAVNCFLLDDDGDVTLVDAGTGTAWGAAFGHARAALDRRGIAPDRVARVLLTHIHGDHALGLFGPHDEAYFRNAEILVPARDLAYFTDELSRATVPKARQGGFDIATKLQHVYRGRIRTFAEGHVLPEVEALPLPGHTPGHTGYLIGSDAKKLLIWADLLHIADLQAADPNVGLVFDLDAGQAAQTRRTALGRAAEKGWTVAGAHVDGFLKVVTSHGSFACVPA